MDSVQGNSSMKREINNLNINNWTAPIIQDLNSIPKGDMPGDKIEISENHVSKANEIFPIIFDKLGEQFITNEESKIVISVHGGSGVGKSEVGSVLGYYFNDMNIKSYILSGDNYPHRIPMYNDEKRYKVFRSAGLKALELEGKLTEQIVDILKNLEIDDSDSNPNLVKEYPWLSVYQKSGIEALEGYLGTENEIDFDRVNKIISEFKSGTDKINLKRMGRTPDELWEDTINFKDIKILIIEWTHGNNKNLNGVDIPILLNSTPKETLEHRTRRNRDGRTDSAFTTMVLKIEQDLLKSQASTAKIILSKSGSIIDYNEYLKLMN